MEKYKIGTAIKVLKSDIGLVLLLGFVLFVACSSDGSDNPDPDPNSGIDPTEETNEETTEETTDDWKTIPVPADAGTGMTWEFQDFSDDFEYDAPADNKGATFFGKWDDWYHNEWSGPGLTIWDRTHSLVEDGVLKIPASRASDGTSINTGCITSTNRVVYPVYIEAYAKIMNSTLANGIWLLSPDDTQEIDICEAYGGAYSESAQKDHTWFAERIHVSHHVFVREPFQDYQPTDSGSWYTDNTTTWRDEYHRYGVYWKDPWHLEYYIDGKLVRTVSGKDDIDPNFYTNSVDPGDTYNDTRTGLSKEMDIIIDAEDQDWRSTPASGLQSDTYTPTNSELANTDDHTLKVDWIRIFKPVSN